MPRQLPRRRVRHSHQQSRQAVFDTFIRQQCSSGGAAGRAHLLLDCDPQILHEMEPISDLTRLRRTLASSLRVQPTSVSADELDRRVLLQASRRTRRAPVVKDVDSQTALQVDYYGAVAPESPPAPETTQIIICVSATPRILPGDHFVFVFVCVPAHSGSMSNGE
jgi:hypothetical protein